MELTCQKSHFDHQCQRQAPEKNHLLSHFLCVGDAISVFSQSAGAWVDGKIIGFVDNGIKDGTYGRMLRVEYAVGQDWYRKVLHPLSNHLKAPSKVTLPANKVANLLHPQDSEESYPKGCCCCDSQGHDLHDYSGPRDPTNHSNRTANTSVEVASQIVVTEPADEEVVATSTTHDPKSVAKTEQITKCEDPLGSTAATDDSDVRSEIDALQASRGKSTLESTLRSLGTVSTESGNLALDDLGMSAEGWSLDQVRSLSRDGDTCVICMDMLSESAVGCLKRLSCGHVLHSSCFHEAYRVHSFNACPMCKEPVEFLYNKSAVSGRFEWVLKLSTSTNHAGNANNDSCEVGKGNGKGMPVEKLKGKGKSKGKGKCKGETLFGAWR